MRVWDIPVNQLCDKHLIAQHHEIHCIYNIITKGLKGFAHHPEVMRWRGHLLALDVTHYRTAHCMKARGMKHLSPFPVLYIDDSIKNYVYPDPWQPVEKQIELLRAKGCGCIREL